MNERTFSNNSGKSGFIPIMFGLKNHYLIFTEIIAFCDLLKTENELSFFVCSNQDIVVTPLLIRCFTELRSSLTMQR